MPDANTAFIVLASVQGALTVVLAGSTYYYARKTRDIAEATRQQAKASVKMAEANMLPLILLWTELVVEWESEPSSSRSLKVWYQNIGAGPAMNIKWDLRPIDGQWLRPPRRVGMGIHEEKTYNLVSVERGSKIDCVVAEYEDVSGTRWETVLKLGSGFSNAESEFRRLDG